MIPTARYARSSYVVIAYQLMGERFAFTAVSRELRCNAATYVRMSRLV